MILETTNKEEWDAIWDCLNDAVKRVNSGLDKKTLLQPADAAKNHGPAAGERAIAHRLACYLECELRRAKLVTDEDSLIVDCEYNRHGDATKTFAVESELKAIVDAARKKKNWEPEEDGFYVFSIAPDIVVHERGHDKRNRLVIELKKASNRETPRYDQLKLELFTVPRQSEYGYGYKYGAWIIAEDTRQPDERELRIDQKWTDGKRIE